ncbi:CapA family protein [Crocinitomicaceae bacterium]|nr:CapA family protein [Crocinitomicaceae bacterium]
MRVILLIFSLIIQISISYCQDSLSLIFIGDIMGHGGQIEAAYNAETKSYNYDAVFEKIKPVLDRADITIANLEVTLAGPPYSGYPQFSSPDALVKSCKRNGIDVLVTANNHSCDRRKNGMIRTLEVLDANQIPHTGTFRNSVERKHNNLLILRKGAIRIGVLNYTYGTNGLKAQKPTSVNYIDTKTMRLDIEKSKLENLDQLIVITHWGLEYQTSPNKSQIKVAEFLLDNGADMVIGGHPHVIQKAIWRKEKNQLVAFSLGNFVSNQASVNTDGGMMLELTLVKNEDNIEIKNPGYHLIWVHKPNVNGKKIYEIIPCNLYENDKTIMNATNNSKMNLFIKNARKIMSQNENIPEVQLH